MRNTNIISFIMIYDVNVYTNTNTSILFKKL